jgi:hypothetical protein
MSFYCRLSEFGFWGYLLGWFLGLGRAMRSGVGGTAKLLFFGGAFIVQAQALRAT